MNASYSMYPGRPNMRSAGLQVSISPEGRFSLNKAATNLFDKEAVEKVFLLWNQSATRIALQRTTKKDARAFKINYAKGGRGAGFNAKHFLEEYIGYDLSKSRSFDAEWNSEEGILEIPISGEHLRRAKHSATPIGSVKKAQSV